MKNLRTPAIIEGIRSKKDRSLGLSVSTPEMTAPEKALFMELQGLNVELKITPMDSEAPEEHHVKTDLATKSPSVRLRNVLYLLWKDKSNDMIFDTYYVTKMEQIIEKYKSFLPKNDF